MAKANCKTLLPKQNRRTKQIAKTKLDYTKQNQTVAQSKPKQFHKTKHLSATSLPRHLFWFCQNIHTSACFVQLVLFENSLPWVGLVEFALVLFELVCVGFTLIYN